MKWGPRALPKERRITAALVMSKKLENPKAEGIRSVALGQQKDAGIQPLGKNYLRLRR